MCGTQHCIGWCLLLLSLLTLLLTARVFMLCRTCPQSIPGTVPATPAGALGAASCSCSPCLSTPPNQSQPPYRQVMMLGVRPRLGVLSAGTQGGGPLHWLHSHHAFHFCFITSICQSPVCALLRLPFCFPPYPQANGASGRSTCQPGRGQSKVPVTWRWLLGAAAAAVAAMSSCC